MTIFIKKLNPKAKLPFYGTEGAAGADLYACIEGDVEIPAGETIMIPTGLSAAIPHGFAGFIFARSGLASKSGLAPANKVGVVDSDYRGEILIPLHNHSGTSKTVKEGDRVAQFVVMATPQFAFKEADDLGDTLRGEGGFGSTGRQ